ncbi:MAG TPA: LLM class flavin-dependent oxidoreductase [Candidatus Korarchaeota archaeon]|nr:LLM class flavin-dependent oxidoreductase [Candidatus Korarchaeota archaeon]
MSEVKFGWRIPSFPVNGSKGKKFIRQILRSLEENEGKYDSAWISDHFIPWANFVPSSTDTLECWTTISYLSGKFQRFDFGAIVLCNSYRNPALLAKMGATLQTLSNGRFILGIGAGWKEDEYLAYGYEFPDTRTRIKQLEEAVQIIKMMWTEEVTTFRGKFYKVEGAYCEPRPDPPPPIMIGGGGEKLTLKVVALFADWWNLPNKTPEIYQHKLNVLKDHCTKVGRDFDEIKKTWVGCAAISKNKNDAIRIAEKSPFSRTIGLEEMIVGSPEQAVRKLKRYVDIGVEHVILRFLDFPRTEGAQLFAQEVIPKFK